LLNEYGLIGGMRITCDIACKVVVKFAWPPLHKESEAILKKEQAIGIGEYNECFLLKTWNKLRVYFQAIKLK
jgi:hypothetical protein